ncbi:hypothetical protein DD238_008462 [Peronospora effusa]|uniref:Uncharacterized protein n=1 Tax=Peronospora effusa TaxID=542832 RepID=A0A3M6V9A9_9STRA|nr:hypothetical protein DD238_008462 [Peronospora effusa]RQM11099.1 hypothetical protein DD237_008402 [Peronospora effusa]
MCRCRGADKLKKELETLALEMGCQAWYTQPTIATALVQEIGWDKLNVRLMTIVLSIENKLVQHGLPPLHNSPRYGDVLGVMPRTRKYRCLIYK